MPCFFRCPSLRTLCKRIEVHDKFVTCTCSIKVAMPTAKKPRDTLVHAHEVGALIHQAYGENYLAEIPHARMRMPMYKANDSNDLHLMELISPAHELHRKLIERRRPMTQLQHTHVNYLPSPNKSLDNTPRTKPFNKQAALKTLRESGPKLNARIFPGGTQARSKQSILTKADQMHQNAPDFERTKTYNSKLLTQREQVNTNDDTVTASGFLSERRPQPKLGFEACYEQRAWDLRLISKLWHHECKSSAHIQQRLAHLLNGKYREAFEDGRMCRLEKCKRSDFQAEVAQIVKKLVQERPGAAQMATLRLRLRRALAVACVDEVVGAGMGEEYVTLERSFVGATRVGSGIFSSRSAMTRDASAVKAVVGRVQSEYVDVRHITRFMLDQLGLSGPLK